MHTSVPVSLLGTAKSSNCLVRSTFSLASNSGNEVRRMKKLLSYRKKSKWFWKYQIFFIKPSVSFELLKAAEGSRPEALNGAKTMEGTILTKSWWCSLIMKNKTKVKIHNKWKRIKFKLRNTNLVTFLDFDFLMFNKSTDRLPVLNFISNSKNLLDQMLYLFKYYSLS